MVLLFSSMFNMGQKNKPAVNIAGLSKQKIKNTNRYKDNKK